MQTSSPDGSPKWTELAGAETIARVEAAIKADPTFLAEAQEDLNGSIERRMGISFPIPLHLEMDGGVGKVWPKRDASGELTDADLDLVSGGSMRVCEGACDPNCDPTCK